MTTHLNSDHSVFDAAGIKVFYSGFLALVDVYLKIPSQNIIASQEYLREYCLRA